ncbi:prephenate dehydratase domain-containing protein, partial [Ferroplasma sp. Type II]
MKIGYFGDPGAYSNIAATRMASGQYVPLDSVRAVFMALKSNNIDLGVVPIENSIEGAV